MTAQVSEKAPVFALPEAPGQMVDLAEHIGTAPVVILFFPLAFSPVCTTEFCTFRDEWESWTRLDAKVFGVSVDSPFATQKFRELENLPFPLLSDFNKDVSASYGALHEDLMGLKGVSKRSAFVVNKDGDIVYAWVSDDPGVQVDFAEIKAAVESC